jgi:hypothetical protein
MKVRQKLCTKNVYNKKETDGTEESEKHHPSERSFGARALWNDVISQNGPRPERPLLRSMMIFSL